MKHLGRVFAASAKRSCYCSRENRRIGSLQNRSSCQLDQLSQASQHTSPAEDSEDDRHAVGNQLASRDKHNPGLYEDHIPTTRLQRGLLTVGSGLMSLYDPYRHDMIAVLGEVTGHNALRRLQLKMLNDPEGKQILADQPRINSRTVDMDWLASLPSGTLGKEYTTFMKKNKISSDSRAPVQFVNDPDLAYVMQRYREIHDLNHLLLGMPTTMSGEVTVKWFEMVNTRLPMTMMGALLGPLRVRRRHYGKLVTEHIPWVIKTAPKARLLINVYFEQRWQQQLAQLQEHCGIEPFVNR